MRGVGSAIFAAILLTVAGTINFVYGIGAISNANFFNGNSYVVANLHTWGWITLLIGVVQFTAGLSLMGGRPYGRIVGIAAATVGAVEALFSVGGHEPVLGARRLRDLPDRHPRPGRPRRAGATRRCGLTGPSR